MIPRELSSFKEAHVDLKKEELELDELEGAPEALGGDDEGCCD